MLMILLLLLSLSGVPVVSLSVLVMPPKTKPMGVEVPREIEVQNKLEVAQSTQVETLGREIIKATGDLASRYVELCNYIRQQKVSPKLVSITLNKLGFRKQRITEINRVAQASDKLFSDFQAKLIGFKSCLNFARLEEGKGGKASPLLSEATKVLVESGALTADEADQAVKDETTPSDARGGEKKSDAMKVKAHALAILRLATRPATFRAADSRFEVHVIKVEQTVPAVGDSKE